MLSPRTREAVGLGAAVGMVVLGSWMIYRWNVRRREEQELGEMLGMFFGGIRRSTPVEANPELVEQARVIIETQPTTHARIASLEAAGHILADGHWMWSETLKKAPAPTPAAVMDRARVVTELCALLGSENKDGRTAVLSSVAEERMRLDGVVPA